MGPQTGVKNVAEDRTTVQRASDRELVVTRLFDARPRIVFRAWAEVDLFRRWWIPKGADLELLSCEMDVRTGALTASSSPLETAPSPFTAAT